jgi:trans-2,3-dihydro-3-hydroxyanthranilate isomerase
MSQHVFHTLDVFTDHVFGGNPLAVFPNGVGLEMGLHQATEIGQMGKFALAPEQRPAEFLFELFDRAGQGRLRDVATLGSAVEVQRLGDSKKIADLV